MMEGGGCESGRASWACVGGGGRKWGWHKPGPALTAAMMRLQTAVRARGGGITGDRWRLTSSPSHLLTFAPARALPALGARQARGTLSTQVGISERRAPRRRTRPKGRVVASFAVFVATKSRPSQPCALRLGMQLESSNPYPACQCRPVAMSGRLLEPRDACIKGSPPKAKDKRV